MFAPDGNALALLRHAPMHNPPRPLNAGSDCQVWVVRCHLGCRDVKASNILLSRDCCAKITDMGLSKAEYFSSSTVFPVSKLTRTPNPAGFTCKLPQWPLAPPLMPLDRSIALPRLARPHPYRYLNPSNMCAR